MLRYLRLYAYMVRFSVIRSLEFRMDFFFRIVMDSIFYFVSIAFFKILYLHTPSLGGWNESQMMVFVSGFLLVDALTMTLFSNNLWWLPILVNRGDLDYYLVRPVSPLFFLSLRDFAFNSCVNLAFSTGIFIWANQRLAPALSPGQLALFMVLILNGAFLHYLLYLMVVLPVFWTQSVEGFRRVFFGLMRLTERPDRIYTGWTRRILTTVIPVCLIISFPSRLVLDGFDWAVFAHLIGMTLAFVGLAGWVWRRGLRSYSSASS